MINRKQNYKFRTVSKICHGKNFNVDPMTNNNLHTITDLVVNISRDNISTKIIINADGDAIFNEKRVSDRELEKILKELV